MPGGTRRERLETSADASQYEVRCLRCNTSFAKGTRRCIHCGERLGAPLSLSLPGDSAAGAPADGELAPGPGRAMVWVMTAILALVGMLLRLCEGA